MENKTFTSSLRNKLTPIKNLIAIIEEIKPVSFNLEQQKVFENAISDAKSSFTEIETTIENEENAI